jgi:hypothetical protein
MSGLILPPHVKAEREKQHVDRKKVQRVGTEEVRQQEVQEEVDILPTELAEIKRVALEIQRRYLYSPVTHATLDAVEDNIKNAFAQIGRSGFKVTVGWEPMANRLGDAAFLPTVTIDGRNEKEFDHEEMSHQVQHGKLDGVVGKMNMDGKLVDPDIVL